ncbi:hypothetical protein [Pleionea sp. CnH1-48]|uniref:hypothetical protein n=1 Tax=Pleionea sp. CnH1-48 TaxID=2954494 RepID=UPI0020977629|nr:hypothetical protein [Pleionea sp. CnH1-48]MCO7225091.1 hypothetical protein [Pleionea sp. CnH1-48]
MKRKKQKLNKPRNPFACDPLMTKSSVHEKTYKAKRKSARQQLKKESLSWDSSFSLIGSLLRII